MNCPLASNLSKPAAGERVVRQCSLRGHQLQLPNLRRCRCRHRFNVGARGVGDDARQRAKSSQLRASLSPAEALFCSRGQVEGLGFANLTPCLIGMEACNGARPSSVAKLPHPITPAPAPNIHNALINPGIHIHSLANPLPAPFANPRLFLQRGQPPSFENSPALYPRLIRRWSSCASPASASALSP